MAAGPLHHIAVAARLIEAAPGEQLVEIPTPSGPARAHLSTVPEPRAALVLGHGAGGGIGARDLLAVKDIALAVGISVALIEQPYRVANRRSAAPAGQLDAAWHSVIDSLRSGPLADLRLVTGGRSSGARVACRTALATGASGVLCLAFPLQPPGRSALGELRPSRHDELDAVRVPLLVVQGLSDPFGMPAARRGRKVVPIRGDHSLRSDLEALRGAVRQWLRRVLAQR